MTKIVPFVFFGTPEYVVPIVDAMHTYHRNVRERGIVAVVTQEPKPAGRKNEIMRSAIDNWAYKHNVEIVFDVTKTPEAEIGIVAAYGSIIPQKVIDRFEQGILNIHPSLLPQFRGASPVQATVVAGIDTTGVTVIKMDEKLDHGPIVSAFKHDIDTTQTHEQLRDELFLRAAEFLPSLVDAYLSGKIQLKEQNHNVATFTRTIKKEDAYIPIEYLQLMLTGKTTDDMWDIGFITNYSQDYSGRNLHNFIRGLSGWPTAYTQLKLDPNSNEHKRLKLISSHMDGENCILDSVQLEGKGIVTFEEFMRGYPNNQLRQR